MAETRASKSKGRKLDSIISKLKILPPQEAVDSPNENSKEGKDENGEKTVENVIENDDVERKRSKRKSKKIVRYRIDGDDDNDEVTVATGDDVDKEPVEEEQSEKHDQLPETIFEELPNGDSATFDDAEDTTVLFLPAEGIQVRAGPPDDYLGELLDGGLGSRDENEVDEEKSKEKKKKKKKSKTYDSDESVDEDGLPRRVICTACGRKVNPSHGTILRHPVLNVLVCKKCNQYYNSGPFTRDEYGIEEQCRWCGDGGDLICCDDCEKVYCKPCIQRNCGKTYLKNLLNAPEDFKWLCIVCEKDKPTKHIQRLRKKCEQVMQVLENLKAQKAHFKSTKGQQTSVVLGPTTSERRNRLNCLSEGLKVEGWSSSSESPTKKAFTSDDLPAELFEKIDNETKEQSDKEKDEENKDNDRESNNAEVDKEEQDDKNKEESDENSDVSSRRKSLRSATTEKKNEEAQPPAHKQGEEGVREKSDNNEEQIENSLEQNSEQPERQKTRNRRQQETNEQQVNVHVEKRDAEKSVDSDSDGESMTTKKTDAEPSVKTEQDESIEQENVAEEDSNVNSVEDKKEEVREEEEEEEAVRITRSGRKSIGKPKRSSSKDTPQQSDAEGSGIDKRENKAKTIIDKVKQENASDELDSSDSASGRRLSRKSKDKANNRLLIRIENKKKTPAKSTQSKSVVVIDSSDDSNDKENDKEKEEQRSKSKVAETSRIKKIAVDLKTEKSSTSDSSDSKIPRSMRKMNGKSPKSTSKRDSKLESDSNSNDSDENLSTLKTKLNRKKTSELSSDSDFQTEKVCKKSNKNRKQHDSQYSSDFESDESTKVKSEEKEYSLEESSESDDVSSESESESYVKPKTNKSRGLQKQTRKRPRPVESSSESKSSSEESSEDEGMAKRTRRRKQIQSDSSDGQRKTKGKTPLNKRQKKTIKKGRKGRKRKTALDSDESDNIENEESSDSESDKKSKSKKGKGKKGKQKKKPAKKGKRRRVRRNSDEESTDDEKEEKSPSKGRKKIRKLLTDDKLDEETLRARRLEEERRKRLLERTRTAEDDELPKESWHLNSIVLEKDKETKEPLVEIKSDLVQHLKPHQAKGIQFMYDNLVDSIEAYKKGDKGGGCILAHCMGLGKTLQVVSLVHTLHNHQEFDFNTTLVIAPLNTVLNWQVEFDKWLNVDERMDVFVLKEAGHNNWHRADMLKQWQRYGGILIIGYDAYRNLSLCSRVRSKHQKKIFIESLVDPGPDLVICDEGHILRNDQSAISKAINSIKTRRRVVLTGTPLQNNLIEYHCMVSFVKPNLLGTRKEFMNLFGNPIMNGQCVDSNPLDVRIMKQSCHVLYKLLEGCVQRRDYSVLTPFLPPKHEYVVKVRLSEVQRKLYGHYLTTFVFPDGAISGRGASLFSDYQCLMRIWTHPWCLKLEAIRRSLRAPYSDSDNSLDGFVVHTDEEEESENDNSSDEISLKSDDSSPKSKRSKKNGEVFELMSSSEEESGPDNTSDEEVMPKPSRRMTRSNGPVKIDDSKEQDSITVEGESSTRSGNTFKEEIVEEKEWYDEFLSPEDEYNVELSGKMALLLEILADAEAVEEKVLVFSQSLVTLDLIERALGGGEVGGDRENWCRGCDYFRLDGSTSVQLRQRWADIFNDVDNKTARLFLISTKAGGLGINLVAANRVVVFDVSWNPSHDVQSIFRVYRFGQTKPVYVYRLVSEGCMEERIYDRQIAKLSTSQRVIDKHQIERHFTAADLAELYRFNPSVHNEETENESVPSLGLPKDAVLADLINRMHPKWIVKYHEHDSLLQNVTAEELTEEERKEAWASYEAQKNQSKQELNVRALQAQYAQQQLQQQRQAIPSQNLNSYSNAVLQQMQQFQRQQLSERMARMQADAAMQERRYLPPQHGVHNQQIRQQMLQHLGAARPVYQPRSGAAYQPMMTYISQQQPQRVLQTHIQTTGQSVQQANQVRPNTVVIRHGAPQPYNRM